MAIKKKKIRQAVLYNIKTSEDKTERILNEGKFVLKPSFKKEKTKVLSTEYTEMLISGIWLLKLKVLVFCKLILLFLKVLLAIKDLPE